MDQLNPDNKHFTVSRRDALKTIAAATGAAALSTLPNRWESPVLETGALPAFAQASPHPFTNKITSVTFAGPNSDLMDWQSEPGWITIFRTPGPPAPPPCGRRPFPGSSPCPWIEDVTVTIVIEFVPWPGFDPSTLPKPGTPLSVIVIDDSKAPPLTCDPIPEPIQVTTAQTITIVFRIPDPCTCTWFHISCAFKNRDITLVNGGQISSADCFGPGIFGGESTTLC